MTDVKPAERVGATPSEAAPSLASRALGLSTVGPLAALLLAAALFSFQSDRFLTGGNLSLVVQQVIVTAGIDLSNGAVMAFGSIVATKLAVGPGGSPVLGVLLGLAVCAAFGAFNGALVTSLRLPPFIVTLGTLNIAFALTHIYSNDQTVSGLPSSLTFFGDTFRVGQTDVIYGSVLMLALLLVARTGVGDPQAGQTDNLDSITAVVLGGTSLFGGRGSVIGTLIGALIVGIVRNGLQLLGVRSIYQVLITGMLVILAVAVDQLARRRQR